MKARWAKYPQVEFIQFPQDARLYKSRELFNELDQETNLVDSLL